MGDLKKHKINRVAQYVSDCYKRLDPKIRDAVFKGGEAQAVTVFLSVSAIRGSRDSLEESTKEDVAKLLSIYIYSALSLSQKNTLKNIATGLHEKFGRYVADDKHAEVMVSFTALNQVDPSFTAIDEKNIPVIIRNIQTLKGSSKVPSEQPKTIDVKKQESARKYYFDSMDEFLIFVTVESVPKANVNWVSNEKYVEAFTAGYKLVDEGRLKDAAACFNRAISVNPVAINARFELIHCYFGLKQIDAAMGSLHYLERYLCRRRDIAKYYRWFGYYFAETQDYNRAVASYRKSLDFEKNPMALGEMMAISNSFGVNLSNQNIDELIKSGGAAILTPWYDEKVGEFEQDKQESPQESTSDDTLRCPSCGNQIPKDSEFCQYCGASLGEENADAIDAVDVGEDIMSPISDDEQDTLPGARISTLEPVPAPTQTEVQEDIAQNDECISKEVLEMPEPVMAETEETHVDVDQIASEEKDFTNRVVSERPDSDLERLSEWESKEQEHALDLHPSQKSAVTDKASIVEPENLNRKGDEVSSTAYYRKPANNKSRGDLKKF